MPAAVFVRSETEQQLHGDGGLAAHLDPLAPLLEQGADLRGPAHVLPLEDEVFLAGGEQALAVQVTGQPGVGGAGGALLGDVPQGGEVAAIGGDPPWPGQNICTPTASCFRESSETSPSFWTAAIRAS